VTLNEAVRALPQLFEQKNYDACANLATQIIQTQPHNPAALYFLASVAELRGARDGAARLYREGSLAFPHDQAFFEAAVRTTPADQAHGFTAEVAKRRAQIAGFPHKPAIELVTNAAGSMFVPVFPDNDLISMAIRSGEVFDRHIIDCAAGYIGRGTAAIDIGANLGQMALQFSRLVGEGGEVFAFEADDFIHHILCQNIKVNSVQNVRTINKAVHEIAGERVYFPDQDFTRFSSFGSYGIDPNAKSGRSVETVTVDSLHIERPVSFMKIDVQGSDLFALRGARETILRHKMPIIFEYEEQFQEEFGTTFQDYVDFVASVGYRFLKTIDSINYLIVAK
jgi:FkbM family methyltransferase